MRPDTYAVTVSNLSALSDGAALVYLRVQTFESSIKSIVRKNRRHGTADIPQALDIGVVADIVRCARVVHPRRLDEDLDVHLIQVLGHAEEAGGEVLGGLDHAVLGLGPEDGDGAGLGEVVEEVAVELAVLDPEQELLAAPERRQQLGAELVGPVGQEGQVAAYLQAVLGRVRDFVGELGRRRAASRIPGAVAVQEMYLGHAAALGGERIGIGQPIIGGR